MRSKRWRTDTCRAEEGGDSAEEDHGRQGSKSVTGGRKRTGAPHEKPEPQLPEDEIPPLPPRSDEPPNAKKPPKHPGHDDPMEPPETEPPRVDPTPQ